MKIYKVYVGIIIGLILVFTATGSVINAADFSLSMEIDNQDISSEGRIEIDSKGVFNVNIWINDITDEVILHNFSVIVTFSEISFPVVSRSLGNDRMLPGDSYYRELTINASEVLGMGGRPLTTGIYRSQIRLEYSIGGQKKAWDRWLDIQITGNPVNSVIGIAGTALGAITACIFIWLGKNLSILYRFAKGRLESFTRGRVVGSIISVSRKFAVKEKCPVCHENFRGKKCIKCGKSVKIIRKEYRKKLEKLAIQGEELLVTGEVKREELGAKLDIDDQTAIDVLKVIDESRMRRMKMFLSGLMVKAIFAGLGFGISTILWVTVGGFTALSTPALVSILVVAFILPLVVTLIFRLMAERAIRRVEARVD